MFDNDILGSGRIIDSSKGHFHKKRKIFEIRYLSVDVVCLLLHLKYTILSTLVHGNSSNATILK